MRARALWQGGGISRHIMTPPAAPSLTAIAPAIGTEDGGDTVVLTGTGFVSGCTVTVGGGAATSVVFNGTTQVTCVTPAGTVGAQDVVLTNPDLQADTLAAGFEYTTAGGFLTPDIVNGHSFESDFQGWNDGGSQSPVGITRDASRPAGLTGGGSIALKKSLPTSSSNSQCFYLWSSLGFPTLDRVYVKFHYYLDTPLDQAGIKFTRYKDSALSVGFSGLGIDVGFIGFRVGPEWDAASPNVVNLIDTTTILNGWHSIEVDYWRNGDVANGGNDYPSLAFWSDGVQITSALTALPSGASWINGRLNVGSRASSAKIGNVEILGLLNAGNLAAGSIWADLVSISTQRIGGA